ncbi:MAG: ATP-dependent sacrificial sulfur transferase LarE, partial [Oscillospiraceae bacterium]|nr:ATP-dependent sacrificial sulfur transferase LarE [Oscillospiraceae bacterium]
MSGNLEKLKSRLQEVSIDNKICIAFSDGVDSTVLLKVAQLAGLNALAVTFDTQLTHNDTGMEKAAQTAQSFDAKHMVINIDMLADRKIASNDKLRCYYCKKKMFDLLLKIAHDNEIKNICDGTNADDLNEYRPGLRAKDESGVLSPLADCGLTKQDVRNIAKELSLSVATKPSSPCRLTRFPYDTKITREMLEKVKQGEDILKLYGFDNCRLRVFGDMAKVEIPKEEFNSFMDKADKMSLLIKLVGFTCV